MKNYYATLGVKSTASQDDIKRAFRQLAVKFHPDKNPSPEAEERFKEITEAYDVLSDWEKRKVYDLRWENPFVDVVTERPRPRHRDPRYRPKPPGYQPPKRHTVMDTMAEYLPYFRYISWVGLIISFFIALDFILPYKENSERLLGVEQVMEGNRFRYFIFRPESGKELKIYDFTARYLTQEEVIVFDETRIFKTVMYISDVGPTFQIKAGYMYKTLGLFPLLLLGCSLLGVFYRQSVELPFNMSIVSALLIVITMSLIFYL